MSIAVLVNYIVYAGPTSILMVRKGDRLDIEN